MSGSELPRAINTREELAALPTMSIVEDAFAAVCVKVHVEAILGWVRVTTALRTMGYRQYREPYLPARLLREGAGS